jgi:DNA-binding NarL/FixJ family response regulator
MRVLLADDHDLVRDGIRAYLEARLPAIVVVTASDFQGALALAAVVPEIDLVMLDLRMPGMDGAAGVERMRAMLPEVPLAILSGYPCLPELAGVLARLRVSFLPKTLSGEALVSMLIEVMGGEIFPPPANPPAAGNGEPVGGDAEPGADARPLTRREREVLSHLSLGLSNKEIARRLTIEEVTVRLHLRGIFRKLGVHNRTQAVRQALDRGLDVTAS